MKNSTNIKLKPGTVALLATVILVLLLVKFALHFVCKTQWDTVDWAVNLVCTALILVFAVEWIIKWALSRKNNQKPEEAVDKK